MHLYTIYTWCVSRLKVLSGLAASSLFLETYYHLYQWFSTFLGLRCPTEAVINLSHPVTQQFAMRSGHIWKCSFNGLLKNAIIRGTHDYYKWRPRVRRNPGWKPLIYTTTSNWKRFTFKRNTYMTSILWGICCGSVSTSYDAFISFNLFRCMA